MRLAAQGLREDEQSEQHRVDKLFDEAAKKQARKVTLLSLATTVLVCVIAYAIPPLR